MKIPAAYQDLLLDDRKAYAFLVTLMEDGSPQITPIWFNWNGENILINTAQGRVKDRNMRRDSRVALAIVDPRDMSRYLQIRGKVVEVRTEGALEHINQLSWKYDGHAWSDSPEQVRVTYIIQPEHVYGG